MTQDPIVAGRHMMAGFFKKIVWISLSILC